MYIVTTSVTKKLNNGLVTLQ